MAQTPEGMVKAAIKKWLLTVPDCWFYMPVQNGMGIVGIPDIVGLIGGRFFAIECKAPGKEKNTTANQDRILGFIRATGGIALVASDVLTVRNHMLTEGISVP